MDELARRDFVDFERLHTNNGVLILSRLINVKEFTSTESEDHAFIVFSELIVDL